MAQPTNFERSPLAARIVRRAALGLGLTMLLAGCHFWSVPTAGPAASPTLPGQLIVKFKPDTPVAVRNQLRATYAVLGTEGVLPDTERWTFNGDAMSLRSKLLANPAFAYVEPNYVRETMAFNAPERTDSGVDQWYLGSQRGINVDAAWSSAAFANASASAQPGSGVTIAVVDTGVDITHPDLKDHIATNSAGAIFLDEVGDDTTLSTGATNFKGRDGNGHGTHVAGILGAEGYNAVTDPRYPVPPHGIVGVAPGVTILPVKTMRADGSGDDFAIAKGLKDAADAGADVINLSVGGPEPSQLLADALAYDFSKGATVVIASGNGYGPVYYPAAYAGVICVGATSGTLGATNSVPAYSNHGPQLSVVAPGGDGSGASASLGIYSTFPTYDCYLSGYPYSKPHDYATQSGTSMATPVVSGVAALVIADAKAHGLHLTPSQVRARLLATATPLSNGFSEQSGYGLINPLKAVTWSGSGGDR